MLEGTQGERVSAVCDYDDDDVHRRMPLLQMWEEEDGGGDEMVVVLVQLSSLPTHYSPTDLHRFTFDKIRFFV